VEIAEGGTLVDIPPVVLLARTLRESDFISVRESDFISVRELFDDLARLSGFVLSLFLEERT